MRRLDRAGAGRLATVLLSLLLTAGVFFGAAGTLAAPRAWAYYGTLLGYLVVAMAFLLVRFPDVVETVNARGRVHRDVKGWDKGFELVYLLLVLAQPAIAGLDAGRLRIAPLPGALLTPGLAATLLAYALVHWAMVVNRYAETGVRIQSDRGQQVVSAGPYRWIRHPFYAGTIVAQLAYPLAVGSGLAFVPSGLMVAALVWRTAREDATLRRELEGYEAYARRTRFRLVPGIW